MKASKIIVIAAVAAACVGLVSCKGRRADATPNGDTVEVVIEPAVAIPDTLPAPAADVEADKGADAVTTEQSMGETAL